MILAWFLAILAQIFVQSTTNLILMNEDVLHSICETFCIKISSLYIYLKTLFMKKTSNFGNLSPILVLNIAWIECLFG